MRKINYGPYFLAPIILLFTYIIYLRTLNKQTSRLIAKDPLFTMAKLLRERHTSNGVRLELEYEVNGVDYLYKKSVSEGFYNCIEGELRLPVVVSAKDPNLCLLILDENLVDKFSVTDSFYKKDLIKCIEKSW